MARMLKGWLPSKILRLMSTFGGKRFQDRRVSARQATRIMMDASGSPVVPIPMMDRLLSRMTGQSLIATIVRRSKLDLSQLSSMSPSRQSKLIRAISGRRALQLFFIDATTNHSKVLTSLLEYHPHILDQVVSSLSKRERVWVFQMFQQPAPELSAPASEHAAQLLAHQVDHKNLAPIMSRLISCSTTEAGAAALSGLYHEQKLDFGLLSEISSSFTAPDHLADPCRDQGRDIVESCHWHAQQHHEKGLTRHMQIYMDLMYQALPQYRDYWSSCTGLPAESCPINDKFESLFASLSRLTPQTVEELCYSQNEEELIATASRHGWKKIQSQSSATLRNPDAATGDFIFRVFSAELEPSWDRL